MLSTPEDGLVSFANQNLKLDTAESAQPLIEKISANLETMTILDFSANTMGIEAAEALKEVLSRATKLKVLRWHDMFTGRMKTEIAPALEHLSEGIMRSGAEIEELDLSHNAFGPNGVVGVTKLLASSACYTLKVLRMDNQGLGHQGCRHLVQALTDSMDASDKLRLRVFSAGRNRLENVGASLLSGVFQRMGSLEELALYQNGIGIHGPEEVNLLLQSLKSNTGLRHLDLSDNSLKSSGAKALAEVLPAMKNLEKLDLGDCIIKRKGCNFLTAAFNITPLLCPKLHTVSLSGNELSSDSALLFLQALLSEDEANVKRPLQKVNLNANAIGKTGIDNLVALLRMDGEDTIQLGSFSEDEGSEEEEEEDSSEEGESFEENEEDGEEGEVNGDNGREYILHKENEDPKVSKCKELEKAAANFSFNTSASRPGGGLFDNISTEKNNTTPSKTLNLFAGFNFPTSTTSASTVQNAAASFSFQTTPTVLAPSKLGDVVSKLPSIATSSPQTLKEFLTKSDKKPDAHAAQQILSQCSNFLTQDMAHHPSVLDTLACAENVEHAVHSLCCLIVDSEESQETTSTGSVSAGVQLAAQICSQLLIQHPSLATNALLVQMGLIKSEEKHFSPACKDARKCLRFASYLVNSRSTGDTPLPVTVIQQLETVMKNLNSRLKTRLTAAQDLQELDSLVGRLSTLTVTPHTH